MLEEQNNSTYVLHGRHVRHKLTSYFTKMASFVESNRKHVALLFTSQGTRVDGCVFLWDLLCDDSWQLCWRLMLKPLVSLAPDSIQKFLQRMLGSSFHLLR